MGHSHARPQSEAESRKPCLHLTHGQETGRWAPGAIAKPLPPALTVQPALPPGLIRFSTTIRTAVLPRGTVQKCPDGEAKERSMAAATQRAPRCVRNPCSRASPVADNQHLGDHRGEDGPAPTRTRPAPPLRPLWT